MGASNSIRCSVLTFRILALASLGASVALLVTNKINTDDSKATFKDFIVYRYVVATASAGILYTLVQIPFAIYHVCNNKRMVRKGCLEEFDFYADKIIALLLASGVGAGFGFGFEFKRITKGTDFVKFLDKANIAVAILLLGCVCMAVLSVISSIIRKPNTSITTTKGYFFR